MNVDDLRLNMVGLMGAGATLREALNPYLKACSFEVLAEVVCALSKDVFECSDLLYAVLRHVRPGDLGRFGQVCLAGHVHPASVALRARSHERRLELMEALAVDIWIGKTLRPVGTFGLGLVLDDTIPWVEGGLRVSGRLAIMGDVTIAPLLSRRRIKFESLDVHGVVSASEAEGLVLNGLKTAGELYLKRGSEVVLRDLTHVFQSVNVEGSRNIALPSLRFVGWNLMEAGAEGLSVPKLEKVGGVHSDGNL